MSVSSKYSKLVNLLYQQTGLKNLSWRDDEFEEDYRTQVGEFTVSIRSSTIDKRPVVKIAIFTGDGREIDTFTDEDIADVEPPTLHSYYALMTELLSSVRRAATGADDVLDTIIEKLDDMPEF